MGEGCGHNLRMPRGDRQQNHQDAVRVYKGVTVFDWDHEPSDMRPSAFVESTQYDSVWAPSTQTRASMLERRRPRPPRKRGGVGTGLVVVVVLLALGVGAALGAWHWRSRGSAPVAGETPRTGPDTAPATPAVAARAR